MADIRLEREGDIMESGFLQSITPRWWCRLFHSHQWHLTTHGTGIDKTFDILYCDRCKQIAWGYKITDKVESGLLLLAILLLGYIIGLIEWGKSKLGIASDFGRDNDDVS